MKGVTIVFLVLVNFCCVAQEAEQSQAVMVPIERLFDGMRDGDSAKVHSAFTQEAEMYSAFIDKEGHSVLHKGSLEKFLIAVGTPHEDQWNEQIWGEKINIDGDLAQVWFNYAFYLGKNLSHCGVDAFHLFYNGDEWRIFHITDTRQKENCHIPEHIKEK